MPSQPGLGKMTTKPLKERRFSTADGLQRRSGERRCLVRAGNALPISAPFFTRCADQTGAARCPYLPINHARDEFSDGHRPSLQLDGHAHEWTSAYGKTPGEMSRSGDANAFISDDFDFI